MATSIYQLYHGAMSIYCPFGTKTSTFLYHIHMYCFDLFFILNVIYIKHNLELLNVMFMNEINLFES